jgi:hypothetical protein
MFSRLFAVSVVSIWWGLFESGCFVSVNFNLLFEAKFLCIVLTRPNFHTVLKSQNRTHVVIWYFEQKKKYIYRVIHNSVKRFINSQQIHYSTDRGSSYADGERKTLRILFVFNTFHRCSVCSTFCNTADIYGMVLSRSTRVSANITVDQSHYYCLLAANQGNYVRGLFL